MFVTKRSMADIEEYDGWGPHGETHTHIPDNDGSNRPLHPTGTAPLPRAKRTLRRGARG
jgi:hypothetical protein